jgi:hypothetical protein
MAGVYLMLAVVGALVPLGAFLPWPPIHGLDVPRFIADLFANPVSSFFGWDVILSGLTLTLFIIVQGRRDKVPGYWIAIVATFVAGVSCGLPLFLALRERMARA